MAKRESVSKKMMGNTNATKWDEQTVMSILTKMEQTLQEDKDIIHINELLIAEKEHKLYPDIWGYWKNIFENNDTVFRTIKRISAEIEVRLFKGGLTNKYNATIAIFGLKNNYNWTDKQQLDLSNQDGTLRHSYTDEELEQKIAALQKRDNTSKT